MYSKDFKAKNRDVIEHYLEQQGSVCNTQRHEQDTMPCTSLSYKKCLLKFWTNNLIIFKTSLCMGAEPNTSTTISSTCTVQCSSGKNEEPERFISCWNTAVPYQPMPSVSPSWHSYKSFAPAVIGVFEQFHEIGPSAVLYPAPRPQGFHAGRYCISLH